MSRIRIGVDMGGTKLEAVALTEDGSEACRLRVPTPRQYDATLRAVADLIQSIENQLKQKAPIGIGMPGAISPHSGRVKNANSTWLNGRLLADDLTDLVGRPLRFENDANCFALSEALDGAASEARAVFGVILGTGTGGGLVMDGKLWRGVNAIGGEWGHNPLPSPRGNERPGPACYCGKTGCIETFLSGPGLARDYEQATGKRLPPEEIARAASDRDPQAEAAMTRYENRLARGLASVINLLDPESIVLGGGISNLQRLYTNVPEIWSAYVFSDHVATRLVPAAHGDSSGVRGAARLWEL